MKEDSIVIIQANQTLAPRARARYLSQAIQLEESHPSRIIGGLVATTLFLLFGIVLWAAFTEISEVAISNGEVVPADLIHNVQHLEGGIIRELNVRNGDQVNRDDVLLRFDPSSSGPELAQMNIRRTGLLLQGERLQALLEEREPDFSFAGAGYQELVDKQRTIYLAQAKTLRSELGVIESQISQRQKEVTSRQNQVDSMRKERDLYAEQVKLRQSLIAQGAVSKLELLSAQTRLAEAESAFRKAVDDSAITETTLEETQQRKLELMAKHLREVELEAGKAASELAEVEQALVQLRDKVSRLVVRSPTDGIVQGLIINNLNAVVNPGEVIMRIVPVRDELIVEARILPEDIGHVHLGQSADIKVTSYDYSRFGILAGKVTKLSATTYLDKEQKPYYRAEIRLERDYLGTDPNQLKVLPGMTVIANIKTGKKSVLDYLLKPVSRGFSNAFKER